MAGNTFLDTLGRTRDQVIEANNPGLKNSWKHLNYKAFVTCQEQGIFVEAWLPDSFSADIAAQYDQPFAQGLNEAFPRLGSMARFVGVNLTTQALTTQVWQGGSLITFSIPFVFRAESSAELDVMQPIKRLMRLTVPKDSAQDGGGLLKAPGPHLDLQRLGTSGRETIANAPRKVVDAALSDVPEKERSKVKQGDMTDLALGWATSKLLNGAERAERAGNEAAKSLSSAIVGSIKNNISLHLGGFLYFPCVVIKDVSPQYNVTISRDGNPSSATVTVNFETLYVPTDRDIEAMFPMTANSDPKRDPTYRPTRGGA